MRRSCVKTLVSWQFATSRDLMQLGLIDGHHVAGVCKEKQRKKGDKKNKNTPQTWAPAVFHAAPWYKVWFFCVSVFCQQTRLLMIQHQRGTNKPGPPVQTSVCCGESAPSSVSIHEKYHKGRTQFLLLQDDEELIRSSNVTRHRVDKCHASHLTAAD